MTRYVLFVAIFFAGYTVVCPEEVMAGGVKMPSSEFSSQISQNNQNGTNNITYARYGDVYVAKNNSFQAKQEALLVAQNPTTLQITNLRWLSWFGDSKPFLTVELMNTSNLPAQNIQVSILNNHTGETVKSLKPYKLSKSYSLKVIGGPIELSSQAKMDWPIASQSDIEPIIKSDCITGAGLEFQPLRTIDFVSGVEGTFSNRESSLFLKVAYTTIFKQHLYLTRLVVIDSATRQSGFMVPRGGNKPVPLVCVGDHGWNSVVQVGNN